MNNDFPKNNLLLQVQVGEHQVTLAFENGMISIESDLRCCTHNQTHEYQHGTYEKIPPLLAFIGEAVVDVEHDEENFKIIFPDNNYILLNKKNSGYESFVITTESVIQVFS